MGYRACTMEQRTTPEVVLADVTAEVHRRLPRT